MEPRSYSVSMEDGRRYVDFEMADNSDPREAKQYVAFRIQLDPEHEQPLVQAALGDAIGKTIKLLEAERRKLQHGALYVIGEAKK